MTTFPSEETTLDPADWDDFRRLAQRMVDDTLDGLASVRDRPAWQPLPDVAKDEMRRPLPRDGLGVEAAYASFRQHIEPYTNGNRHPGFLGWAQGNGTPLGAMADFLAAAMNPHCAGFEQASLYVEMQVIEWLRELMGFPEGSSGILLSGGSMANLVGLAAARDRGAGRDLWCEGMQGDGPKLVFYGSSEMHGWAPKAASLLGIGNDHYRSIPVDSDHRVSIEALREAIASDRAAGHCPFCVLATAGTVNVGATDDLETIADLCRDEGLWFHVDGAFGAWARLSETHADGVRGLERADSLAFDLHKWGFLPYECACVLLSDPDAHQRPFTIEGDYIQAAERGTFAAGIPFAQRGFELTRSFRALKVWMAFTAHGVDAHAALVDQNLAQASRLAERVDAHPLLERTAPVPLNIVCFRAKPEGRSAAELDQINRELLMRVQESGRFVPSGTTIDGKFSLRACFTNHRTRQHDVDDFAALVGELARAL